MRWVVLQVVPLLVLCAVLWAVLWAARWLPSGGEVAAVAH